MRAVGLALALAAPAAAQRPATPPPRPAAKPVPRPIPEPTFSIRPFLMGTEEMFAAAETFKAVFGQSRAPFFGGGVQVVIHSRYFVEVTASQFEKTGQRVFRDSGKNYGLGIPLTATIMPVEITGGYRFRLRYLPKVRPYLAGGLGSYGYKESSAFSELGDNTDTRHTGVIATGGVEVRLHTWVGVSGDLSYTHVPGIIGTAGISKEVGESDLGGVAVRLKLMVGR